jgi:hypothetical protein
VGGLAKDLVKSCRSGGPAAIGVWASQWIEALAAHQREPDALRDGTEMTARANQVGHFARTKLSGGEGAPSRCVLADAQFVNRAGAWLSELAELREARRVTGPGGNRIAALAVRNAEFGV